MFELILNQFNAFAEATKTSELPIFPHDYYGNIRATTYVKYMVVFSKTSRTSYSGNSRVIPGIVMLSIFYPSGAGQDAAVAASTRLVESFEAKTPIEGLQTDLASLQFLGQDAANKTLSRADLTIPFNYYGD